MILINKNTNVQSQASDQSEDNERWRENKYQGYKDADN